MKAWPTGISTITLFVEDLDAAKEFYQSTFGLPVVFGDGDSAVYNFGNIQINLLKVAQAPELIEPAAVGPAGAGARALMTITVDDVDAVCERLTAQGVQLLNGPVDRWWGVRTAAFADPAGHMWEVAQPLST